MQASGKLGLQKINTLNIKINASLSQTKECTVLPSAKDFKLGEN